MKKSAPFEKKSASLECGGLAPLCYRRCVIETKAAPGRRTPRRGAKQRSASKNWPPRWRARRKSSSARPRGFIGWLTDTDHKAIGLRYIVTAFVFFVLGGIEAALMRIQLAFPDNHFLSPDQYNQVFTVHGTTMMFLFAVPIMTAMGIYFVPLMIGARDVAFLLPSSRPARTRSSPPSKPGTAPGASRCRSD